MSVKKPVNVSDSAFEDDAEPGRRGLFPMEPGSSTEAELSPSLITTRVMAFHEGVYKRLLIHGGGDYWIKMDRNLGPCMNISAIFFDRLDMPKEAPVNWFSSAYLPPAATEYTSDAGPKGAAARLWATLDKSYDRSGYASVVDSARLKAYRTGVSAEMDEQTLTNWRRKLLMLTETDRDQFDQAAGLAPPPGL